MKRNEKFVTVTIFHLFNTASLEDLYCFNYQGDEDTLPRHAGWNFFNVQSEFQRQSVPNEEWSLSYLNSNYEVGIIALISYWGGIQ